MKRMALWIVAAALPLLLASSSIRAEEEKKDPPKKEEPKKEEPKKEEPKKKKKIPGF